MTLLISTFAAIAVSIIWYRGLPEDRYNIKDLVFMFWGATLMWFVDAVFAYMELGMEYFYPDAAALLNDTFLGFSVVAFALVIWFIRLLLRDPEHKIKNMLKKA